MAAQCGALAGARPGRRRAARPPVRLEQRRARADVFDGERRVAQLSLDHVRLDLTGVRRSAGSNLLRAGGRTGVAGTEADLASIAADLSTAWRLIPEPRSKFERAFAIVRERKAVVGLLLTPEERRVLAAHAADSSSPYAHRAAAVLGKADGLGREPSSRAASSPPAARAMGASFSCAAAGDSG